MGTAIFFINTASLIFSDELFASSENVSMEITFSEARIKIGARNYQMVIRMQRLLTFFYGCRKVAKFDKNISIR